MYNTFFKRHSITIESKVGALEGQLWCKVLICDIWETFKALKTFFFKTWGRKRSRPFWPKTPAERDRLAPPTGRAGLRLLAILSTFVSIALYIKIWQKLRTIYGRNNYSINKNLQLFWLSVRYLFIKQSIIWIQLLHCRYLAFFLSTVIVKWISLGFIMLIHKTSNTRTLH